MGEGEKVVIVDVWIFFVVVFIAGSLYIEIMKVIQSRRSRGYFRERRKVKNIIPLEPVGKQVLAETIELIDEDKLQTRDGMRLVIKMMSEIYISEMQRTLKINEIVEQFNVLSNKSVVTFVETYPKFSLFLALVIIAWVTDEIRAPIIKLILNKLGISF